MPYRSLRANLIIETAETLAARIGERFPKSGLTGVAKELIALSKDIQTDVKTIGEPIVWLRMVLGIVVASGTGAFILLAWLVAKDSTEAIGASDLVQAVEAAINTAVLSGAGLFTLVKLEERLKRQRALNGLHGIRSLIHVIDMHQLTKDPAALNADFAPTASSPTRQMNRAELLRYLDYCSEMLALTGKIAALYAQALDDAVVVGAVNDIETLGSNLSRKVWQKISLISSTGSQRLPKGG